jgi:hypothetical protein
MTRMRGVLVSAIAVAAVTAGYFVFRHSDRELPVRPADLPSKSAVSRVTKIAPVTHAPATGTADGSRSRGEGYRKTFVHASNYYEFIRNAIGAAREGNPEAQFYISEALNYCDWGYNSFFRRKPDSPATSLEEAMGRFTVHFPNAVAFIHDIYDRCHVLMEKDVAQCCFLGCARPIDRRISSARSVQERAIPCPSAPQVGNNAHVRGQLRDLMWQPGRHVLRGLAEPRGLQRRCSSVPDDWR